MRFPTFGLFIFFLFSCGSNKEEPILRIAAAANTQFALSYLCDQFEIENGIKTDLIIGSSGQLTAQILNGAPYDVFLSADQAYPLAIYNQNKGAQEPVMYAKGQLCLCSASIEDISLATLSSGEIRTLALPNPDLAPYGQAAETMMQRMGIFENQKSKFVFGESVSQTSHFIKTGAADAGFTALSIAESPDWKDLYCTKLDTSLYAPLAQYMITIDRGQETHPLADRFIAYLLSNRSQMVLKRFGYLPAK